jgi:hypothetical protein
MLGLDSDFMVWHCSVWLGVLFQIHPWGMDTCFPLFVLSIQLYCIYMSSYKYLGFFNEIGNNGRHVFLLSKGWPASLIAHFERQKCTSVLYMTRAEHVNEPEWIFY